jgi:hypothetical protein
MNVQIVLSDGETFTAETDGFEISRAGALVLYETTGPGLHQEITHVFADGQWLRVTRIK